MLELLKKLCTLDGPSSFEDEVRDYIRERVEKAGCEAYEDAMGNLIVHKPGRATKQKVLYSAHMDEVGFIITDITSDGYLKFACVGGIDTRVIIGKRCTVGPNRIPGIVGIKAVHLTSPEERKSVPKVKDMYIDIGCDSKEQAEKLVEKGEYAVFDSEPIEFGDGMLKARAIDDRIGCAVMIRLIEETDIESWYTFVVQEEVGTRGSGPAAYRVAPDVAIILEGTTAGDIPEATKDKKVCGPKKGAVLPFMDNSAVYSPELFRELCAIGDKHGIKYQVKEYVSGGTDAGKIQRSRAGVKVAAISAAVRYIHSPSCVASIDDFEDIYRLAAEYLKGQVK